LVVQRGKVLSKLKRLVLFFSSVRGPRKGRHGRDVADGELDVITDRGRAGWMSMAPDGSMDLGLLLRRVGVSDRSILRSGV
jgi:hypothetical protein